MIKQETIDLVRSRADIVDVIGSRLKLKRAGSSMMACCPFHGEKTPSFHVWQKSQQFKCFGCGESGDAISFLMKHEKLQFAEAIEQLAGQYNISIEYDEVQRQEAQEKKDKKAEMQQVLDFAWKHYHKGLMALPEDAAAKQYLMKRHIDNDMMHKWGLGYAPMDFKHLTTPLINMGKYEPAVDAGVVNTKDGKSYDFLVNRIVIPVHDVNGRLVTLAGREVPGSGKETAKYLNGRESLLYSKSKVLYGLYQAVNSKAIDAAGFAYMVEGYFDVISLHEAEVQNALAPCGTAITMEQASFLKRYTSHIVLMQDADKAGVKSMLKAIDLFLSLDFKVEVVELPAKMDPDEYVRHLKAA
jgi:DNA primase